MELAVLAPGISELGANEHFRPLGRPEQLSDTAVSNAPDCGVTLTVTLPDAPAERAIVAALTLRVNPGLLVAQ